MFEADDAEFQAWLTDLPEPDWDEHPVYAAMVPPGERLARAVAAAPAVRGTGVLAGLDARGLSPAERVDLLAALAAQRNWVDAAVLRVLAVIADADPSPLGLAGEAVSAALRVPLRTAQAQLRSAQTLVGRLPATLSMVEQGAITARHAQVIIEHAALLEAGMPTAQSDAEGAADGSVDVELLARFEARVLRRAGEQTVAQVQGVARRAVLALDPAGGQARHEVARAGRRVGFQALPDGMAQLPVLLPAEDAQAVFTRLTRAACRVPGRDGRSMDQKRADLLVAAVLAGIPSEDGLPAPAGRRPGIEVVVSADTLLGLDDQPAELAGYGPITAETARRLAADAGGTWRRLLTDPDTGALLDISPRRYRPGRRLRDFITARDGVCCFPTCHQPGYRCEFEHVRPYLAGGPTCRCNGALACRRHNLCKIGTGWNYQLNPDASFTWTSDTGHRYRSYPPERWTRRRTETATGDGHGDRGGGAIGAGEGRELQPGGWPRRPRLSLQQIHAREDQAHHNLVQALTTELDHAQRAGDTEHANTTRAALNHAHRQRERELAHRADPSQAPF